MKELNEFEHNGWIKFGYDQRLVRWAKLANSKIIAKQKNKESFENSLTCEGTWFVGVDALGNNPDGTLDEIPLQGPFESLMKSYKVHSLHSAQISIIFQGYPKPRDQESESSFNFRLKRDAAHIDGLIADFPGGPRKLKEPHAYVLGIPLNQAPKGASPVVVWEGSHHLISEAFKKFFLNFRIKNINFFICIFNNTPFVRKNGRFMNIISDIKCFDINSFDFYKPHTSYYTDPVSY